MKFLQNLFKNRKLDFVPADHTHYEKLSTYNMYWKKDGENIFLWNGVGHFWQQMFHIDFEKYKTKLIEVDSDE